MPKSTVSVTRQVASRPTRFAAIGGTLLAVVTDGSDATYLRRSSIGSPGAYYLIGAPSIPAGNDIATVVPCARIKQTTGTPPQMLALNMFGKTGFADYAAGHKIGFPGVYEAATSVEAAAWKGQGISPNGLDWLTALQAGGIGIAVDDGHAPTDSDRDYIYELSAAVYHAARPTASVTTDPVSPVPTSYPRITVTISALIEAWQDNASAVTGTDCSLELRVFSAAEYGAAGFDPATAASYIGAVGSLPLSYIDGSTLSTASTDPFTLGAALANGTYRAYVRATRSFPGALPGAWSYTQFDVTPALPTPPSVSTLKDDAAQSVTVTVTPQASTGASDPVVTVQRSADDGLSWQTVHDAASIPGSFGTSLVVVDRTAPRGVGLLYRANVTATVDTWQLASLWTVASATGMLSAAGWNIKIPDASGMDLIGALVLADPSFERIEDVVEYNIPGRTYPVVVSLALNGIDGGLDLVTRTEPEWTLLQGIMDYRGPVYLESPFGWGRWIRIMPSGGGRSSARKWSELGTPGYARRTVHLDYREVAEP